MSQLCWNFWRCEQDVAEDGDGDGDGNGRVLFPVLGVVHPCSKSRASNDVRNLLDMITDVSRMLLWLSAILMCL